MSTFSELYRVGHMETLRFFFTGLTDLVPTERGLTKKETLYVASILAHYAQTSRHENEGMPPMADLVEFFDCFVLGQMVAPRDAEMLEVAGAQSLFLAGFFGDQMRKRHNLRYYDFVGSSFYDRACHWTKDISKKVLFGLMSSHFPAWTRHCRDLSRTIRENRFLINPPRGLKP